MGGVTEPSPRAPRLPETLVALRDRVEGPLVYAAKTAVAAGVSWFIAANLLGNQIPVFAPLAAVLTVQVTIWQSVSRGLQRVAGVMVGVLLAGAFARFAGIHAWSIAVIIFVALLVGRALRLGTQGSIQVPISALLVLVLGATTGGYGLDRVVDTAIGAACGILVNLAVFPSVHLEEARTAVRTLAEGLASVLRSVAARIDGGQASPAGPAGEAGAPLGAARLLGDQVTVAAHAVGRAEESSRWHPAGPRGRAAVQGLESAVTVLGMVERQVRGIARTVTEAGPTWDLPAPPSAALARLLTQVAAELETWTPPHPAPVAPATALAPAESPAPGDGGMYESVVDALRAPGLDPHAAALAAAIAVDARRIREELTSPPPPTVRTPSWRSLFDQTSV
jgi:hypothetical protein